MGSGLCGYCRALLFSLAEVQRRERDCNFSRRDAGALSTLRGGIPHLLCRSTRIWQQSDGMERGRGHRVPFFLAPLCAAHDFLSEQSRCPLRGGHCGLPLLAPYKESEAYFCLQDKSVGSEPIPAHLGDG